MNTKHVIVIQHRLGPLRTGGNTRHPWPHVGSTHHTQDTRNVGDIRLLMLSGRGQVHASVYFVAGAVKT